MNDEAIDLAKTLIYTVSVIVTGSEADRQRVASAYWTARQVTAAILLDNGDARPRILACLEQFNSHSTSEETEASAGWMLAAIEERVNERTLPGWQRFRAVLDEAVDLLPQVVPIVH